MPCRCFNRRRLRVGLLVLTAMAGFAGPGPAAEGAANPTTIAAVTVRPPRVGPGVPFRIEYDFQANGPLSTAYSVFVHFRDPEGRMVGQGDHAPPLPTDSAGWKGRIQYEQTSRLPADAPDGVYSIVAGLWTSGAGRALLLPGDRVRDLGDRGYRVGTVTIDRSAPRPRADTEGPRTLDLEGYRRVFSEEFDGPLDVSPRGPGTRWIAHTPWNGDFGDAAFADPDPAAGFPFTIHDGILRIEARKDARGHWAAGLLASNDPHGQGFSLQYGYFEMRAQLPPGRGVWPAFWLCSSYDRTDREAGADGSVEIDMMEYYGDEAGGSFMSTVHVWKPEPHRGEGWQVTTRPRELTTGFHDYGLLVESEFITVYLDGVALHRFRTPPEHNKPLMILLNLALGGGWPIDETPNPSFMYVDHVRAYAPAERR